MGLFLVHVQRLVAVQALFVLAEKQVCRSTFHDDAVRTRRTCSRDAHALPVGSKHLDCRSTAAGADGALLKPPIRVPRCHYYPRSHAWHWLDFAC